MYAQHDGLIFDMAGTLLDAEPRIVSLDRGPGPLRYAFRPAGDDSPQRIPNLAYCAGRD